MVEIATAVEPLTKALVFERLRAIARAWGGDIVQISQEEYRGLEVRLTFGSAPFTSWDLGCDHLTKTVIVSDYCEPAEVEDYALGLIHELAHVFASNTAPNDMVPHKNDEWAFLGWELVMSEQIGLTRDQFYTGNGDYMVIGDAGIDIQELLWRGDVGRRALEEILDERVQHACSIGIVKDRTPISVRSPS